MRSSLALRTLAVLAALAAAPSWAGVQFTHRDWQLACDNTRTCRAAGYQADEAAPAVSVLLTRAAGPARAVTAQVAIGTYDDSKAAAPSQVELSVAGRSFGAIVLKPGEATGSLEAAQVAALLQGLLRNEEIAFGAGQQRWRLSDDGAAAVLLRMDDIQGRVGTTGALVRKGSGGEEHVLRSLPKPVVQAAAVGVAAGQALAVAVLRSLRKAPGDCQDLKEPGEAPKAWRLQGRKVLVSARCWVAAYNVGYGFWVANDKPPYQPVAVTTDGTAFEPERSRIIAMQKGRGLADCYAIDEWVWDGQRFVHTGESTTGMCRLVAAGGPWTLTTLVSEVLAPPEQRTTEEKRK